MLLSTGDHDDRVVPLHSYKLIAELQHTLAGSKDSVQRNPLLIRIDVSVSASRILHRRTQYISACVSCTSSIA